MVREGFRSVVITPMGKPRMTQSDKWRQRPAVLRYRQFCDELREALPGFELPCEIQLTFFIKMPPSWSRKKQTALVGSPHDQKPDIDNLAKAFLDAFKTEDKHVYHLNAMKYWSYVGSIDIYVPPPFPSRPNDEKGIDAIPDEVPF
jgi:Holliday junction resolvase RusA-like endonuclease